MLPIVIEPHYAHDIKTEQLVSYQIVTFDVTYPVKVALINSKSEIKHCRGRNKSIDPKINIEQTTGRNQKLGLGDCWRSLPVPCLYCLPNHASLLPSFSLLWCFPLPYGGLSACLSLETLLVFIACLSSLTTFYADHQKQTSPK